MTMWKSFLIRAASALVAVALIVGLYIGWMTDGLKVAIGIAVVLGTLELINILFQNDKSLFLKILFFFVSCSVFAISAIALSAGSLAFSLGVIIMATAVLISMHKEGNLNSMALYQAKCALGLFYIGLLPSFAFKILEQAQGLFWFVFLLSVVFAGDTLAYVFGVLIGKNKVMPSVSPKKTWQGSFGGILGSMSAAFAVWHFCFSQSEIFPFLILGFLAGVAGQFGDFFESLLKRVADVKDSGKLMPGHGGILDRVDGVLFASPVVLVGILILSHLSS